jgi:hypothetical protein
MNSAAAPVDAAKAAMMHVYATGILARSTMAASQGK